jgi:hypothetical protein
MVSLMLFDKLTKGSYDFLGGSEVDVCSMSHQSILTALTLQGGKWARVCL